MARGQYYQEGFEEGKGASYETDWQEGEMQQKYDRDELGEVAGQILENWQQMAGTIYYQDRTERQLDQFEEGFYAGFQRGVEEQLGKRKRKNPGSRWHGRQATEAEEARVKAEDRGSFIGSHFFRGKREAHRESQDESRRIGLNPERYFVSIIVPQWSDWKGLGREIHKQFPNVRVDTKQRGRVFVVGDREDIKNIRIQVVSNITYARVSDVHPYYGKNPGAAWHREQEHLAEAMEKRETRPRQRTYLRGMADAHTLSAHESRKMGLNPVVKQRKRGQNPRPSAIPAHKLAAANRYVNLIRNKAKRDYGFAYLSWMKGGAVGHEPEHPGLSVMGAQAVRLQLDAMKLWENPRGARTRNPDIGMTFNTKAKAKRYAAAMQKLGHSVSLVPQQYGTWRVVIHEKKENPRLKMWLVTYYRGGKEQGHTSVAAQTPKTALAHAKRKYLHWKVGDTFKVKPYYKNPIAVYNPPPGRIIYGRVLAVEAQKTNGSHRGKRFRHSFAGDSRVTAYAMPDGSVLLKSAAGKRLWADR